MREILFRGKRTTDGEWCEGNLFIDEKGEKHEILLGYTNYRIAWEVIPSTIGQFTGLTDKNGKKIFEGDIVVMVGDAISTITEEECKFVVRWQDEECGFNLLIMFDYEVIGNIHDNSEFLWSVY